MVTELFKVLITSLILGLLGLRNIQGERGLIINSIKQRGMESRGKMERVLKYR